MIFKDYRNYLEVDLEKKRAINDILYPTECNMEFQDLQCDKLFSCLKQEIKVAKYCPECYREYPAKENICFDCLVALKNISDIVPVREIKSHPDFPVKGKNSFDTLEDILTDDNLSRIEEFNFNVKNYRSTVRKIKRTALKNFDELIKTNEINLNRLSAHDKVLLFAKSFVNVDYKSHGQELGYFEFGNITIDERQSDALQVTTLIHELSHFLIKEILTHIMCRILNCTKNENMEKIATFILSYSHITQLIDEYCAHTTEGRFTVYGYQDYSSFLSIIERMADELTKDDVEMTKSIGNTFSISIKDILETFIDYDLRCDIRDDFLVTTRDSPNYEMLALENCDRLTEEGFVKIIGFILQEGFKTSQANIEKIENY